MTPWALVEVPFFCWETSFYWLWPVLKEALCHFARIRARFDPQMPRCLHSRWHNRANYAREDLCGRVCGISGRCQSSSSFSGCNPVTPAIKRRPELGPLMDHRPLKRVLLYLILLYCPYSNPLRILLLPIFIRILFFCYLLGLLSSLSIAQNRLLPFRIAIPAALR